MKQIFRKAFLLLFGGLFVSNAAWADEITVPTPVYSNDFSSTDGLTVVGNGVFEDDADPRFGKVFHNDPGATPEKGIRTNYLKLPDDVLSHSGTTKAITIGFWVNVKNAANYWFSPIFSAYALSPDATNGNNGNFPMFVLQSRGLMQLNNGGYDNFEASDNVAGSNFESTVWLDDKAWHYYTMTMTTSSAKVYVDGVIKNEWNINGEEGHYVEGFFTYGGNYKYICLGGNQAWDWPDYDPAYAFDDFAVYDEALSVDQIKQIMKNKLVQGTQIGEIDCSTTYLAESSNKIVLRPGESAKFRFNNYIRVGALNNEAWHLIVADPDNTNKILIRADWWDDLNGSTVEEHQRGFSTNAGNYWDNVPSKMDGATVEMTVTFTSDKKFTMASTTTSQDGSTTWTYNYTSDNANIINLDLSSLKVALSVNLSWIDLLSNSITTTIGDIGWATFVSNNALDFTGSGVKAYVVTGASGSAITKTAVTTVAANTPLLLNAPEGTYTIPVATSGTSYSGTNKLVAGDGSTITSSTGAGFNYVLGEEGGNAMFLLINSTPAVVPQGKAYLALGAAPARGLNLFDDEETTGVNEVKTQKVAGEYFNLAGQRVAQPTKGLYIVNGKKVVIK